MGVIYMKNINKKGFTLAEILIVIAIIAILSIIALTQYKTQIAKAFDKKRKDHLYRLKVALEEYYADNNCYPTSLPDCGVSFAPYLPQIPCDPQSKEPYEYVYDEQACPQWFKVYTLLDNTADAKITEVGCAAGCGPDDNGDGSSDYNYGVSSTNTIVGEGVTATPTPGPTPEEGICTCEGGCYACTGIGVCEKIAEKGQKNCWSPNFCSSGECGGCEETAHYSCSL